MVTTPITNKRGGIIMKKIMAMGVLLILLTAGGLIWHNLNTRESATVVTPKKLMSATKLGEVTRLKEMWEFDQQLVYVLYPYQNTIPSDNPQAERINQHLRSIKYMGDEGYWSLVFVDDQRVTITTFNRGKIPILGRHEINDRDRLSVPANFEPATWAEINDAAFFKLYKDDRQYLIFGRIR
jgi:hypothetical protein